MFGQNPIRKQEWKSDGLSLRVQSLFPTIQGEGPFVGIPAVFLRLAGCNLRCNFCDTDFESRYANVQSLPTIVEQVVAAARGLHTRLVVLTGGEPLRQNVAPLVGSLTAGKFHIQFETAGTLWLEDLDRYVSLDWRRLQPGCSFVVSPKTGKVNPKIRIHADSWKYVMRVGEESPYDGLPLVSPQTGRSDTLARPAAEIERHNIFVQPCEEYTTTNVPIIGRAEAPYIPEPPRLVPDERRTQENVRLCAELAQKYGYRVSLQTHKILGID